MGKDPVGTLRSHYLLIGAVLAVTILAAVTGLGADEAALFELIQARRAAYLMTFPSWYPHLVANNQLQPRYHTAAPWAPQAGGENMVVYEIEYVE